MKNILYMILIVYYYVVQNIVLLHKKLYISGRYGYLKIKGLRGKNNPFEGININIKGAQYMDINGKVGNNSILECSTSNLHQGTISIGERTWIGEYSHLTASNGIYIGKGVLTGRFVLISDNNHGRNIDISELSIQPSKRSLYSKGPIIIEDNVWIGDRVTILGGVKIGIGSIIAADAVVTKDIPSYSVAAGNPARIIRTVSKV